MLALTVVAATLPGHFSPLSSSPDTAHLLLVEREAILMGTRLRAAVRAPDAAAGFAAIERAFEAVRGWERRLSSWRADSELSRINRAAPGAPQRVSGELFRLLAEVWRLSEVTNRAFDPRVGALIDVWDLRGEGRVPAAAELEAALAASGEAGFELDARTGTLTRRRAEAWITAGGFGKGAALRAARDALLAAGIESALLDFGGQLVVIGSDGEGAGWMVGVADPTRRQESVAALRLEGVSVATSGASERFVEVNGQKYGHVLDPRSGRPVPAWGSVTVVAADPLLADVISTALFVMGPHAGVAWAEGEGREGIGVLWLREGERAVEAMWNRELERWLVRVRAAGAQAGAEAGEFGH